MDNMSAQQRARDKTDFRVRLALIEELRDAPEPESVALLTWIMKNDFVFNVRTAAWRALAHKGVDCPPPREKSRVRLCLERTARKTGRGLHKLYDWLWVFT
ncbi:HEAT repeat domain-containing protein [Cronobacter dublinensis]